MNVLAWTKQVRDLHRLYAAKQNSFWKAKVKDSHSNPKKLWKTLSHVLCQDQSRKTIPSDSEVNAENFLKAFEAKVESVRASTSSVPPPVFQGDGCSPIFDQFVDIDADEAVKLVRGAANKNCELDPVPTWIIEEFVEDLAPFIAHLINASTRTGSFPSDQKCAMVTPILKKISLDPWDLSNYRPVSNLSFISKILERSVYTQLNGYLHAHNLLPAKQSAYRKFHSTETTLIDILCDVHSAVDAGQLTLLALLDQSAAFDVIDHQILFERLRHSFGLSGKALEWIRSYLTDRSFYVKFNGISFSISSLICGVPQGSVLGPLLFILYTAELISLVEKHGFNAHTYADDLQIYGHTNTDQAPYLVQRLSNCIDAVKDWMAKNRLRLNPARTELIWLGSSFHLQHAPITKEPLLISGTSILPSKQVRNLGVILECDLSMTAHVNKLLGTCFYHIRQLRLVRRSLDEDAAHALVRALIHSRLDYCNGVLANLTMEKFGRLQSVLKAAARLIFKFPGRTSDTELIRSRLHWLSYPDRITYKLCVLAYKCEHGAAPVYLSRRLVPTSVIPGRAKLRSASSGLLIVPYVPSKTIGSNRSFSYCAPVAWNRLHILSDGLTDPQISLASFKKQLKTFLFKNGDVLLHSSK